MLNPSELKVIFFDIGNVFVSDDPSACFAYRCLFDRLKSHGEPITAEEFFDLRTSHVQAGGNLWSFVKGYVNEPEFKAWQREVRSQMYAQWSHLSPEIKLMAQVPARLAPHYRLGIIANQPGQVEGVLAERGVLNYFEIRGISDVLNLHKPNEEFFRWALDQARVEPRQALMIGDRVDNDVRPAKAIGMQTAWLRLNHDNRGWKPSDHFEELYAKSAAVSNWSDWPPTGPQDEPDITVHNADELLDALVPQAV